MIRLLIVDDEPVERMALQKMITDGFPEIEVAGHAGNGREAVEAAAELAPDLVTMDIKMPGMSGLEAIERIREFSRAPKFIVVTAYDTFEFARQALQLGVRDYLLKPSRYSVVLETIGRVVEEIKRARREAEERRLEREKLMRMLPVVEADIVSQLLFDQAPSRHLGEMIDMLGLPSVRGSFVLNVTAPLASESAGPEGLEELQGRLARVLRDAAVPFWTGKPLGRQIPFIVFLDGDFSYRHYAVGLGRRLVQAGHGQEGEGFYIGIGGFCRELTELRRSYHEALLSSTEPGPSVRFRLYEDLVYGGDGPATSASHLLEKEKGVLEEVRRGNWTAAGLLLEEMTDLHEGEGHPVSLAQQRVFEALVLSVRLLQDMGIEVPKPYFAVPAESYRQLKADTRQVTGRLAEAASRKAADMDNDQLLVLKKYIKDHAHEDLSLERIAAVADRNPYYVSKRFKEHFGVNYIDYLTECRMEAAKQLMQDTDKSLKEITYEIGYNDPNYFSRIFRRMVGCSPTDYRRMLLKPNQTGP